ncbi:MAG: transcription elongation factor GreA [Micrococcales bacterium]|nr:transcription elongation factor GreA [Micrococcales bacterium]
MTTWLTEEAFGKLQAELSQLQGPGMAAVVQRIEAARAEGDLKENGGYHAAREEQAKMNGRIAQLKALLKTAQVGQAPVDTSTVSPGTVVTAQVAGQEMVFLLGSREGASTLDVDVYSEASPLGQAVNGAKPGDQRVFVTPTGKQVPVLVKSVATYGG